MRTLSSSPERVLEAGKEYTVPEPVGRPLVEANYAVELPPARPRLEVASVGAPESAAQRRRRG